MAVVSPHQPQTLTPPSSSHGGRGQWDFAVPLSSEPENSAVSDPKPFMSENAGAKPLAQSSRQPLTNGTSKPPFQQRTNTFDSQRSSRSNHVEEPEHLVPSRVGLLQRKTSDISATSDADSLLDYYKQPQSRTMSRNPSQSVGNGDKRKPSLGASADLEKDASYWIHRDKLAQIERIELEAAGYRVGRASRSGSRSASMTRPARERSSSDQHRETQGNGDDRPNNHQEKKQRTVSPIPAEEEDVDEGPMTWDIRTPEEIAAEQEKENMTPRHTLRPSNSRIPVAKTSPVPVPFTFVERDSPLPRSRKGSNAWSGDAIAVNGARARSGSIGSQVLLDDVDNAEDVRTPVRPEANYSASPAESPPKAKVPGKNNPTSGNRKTSAARGTSQKPRTASTTTSPVKRPGTSSGASRPATSHNRPEGDAPWLATMYKPDPRLPPDQQIIPTHAKRMQQEQWETEGRVGSMYDREFKMLNTEEFNKPERYSKELQPFEKKEDDNEQWPLPSPTKVDAANGRPGTSNGEQGNYKLTPRIASPQLHSQRNSSDGEEPTSPIAEETAEVEVSADASAGKGQMSVLEALKGVLKLALIHDGLARGLREASKALDRRQAHMCVLNEACEEEAYKKLVVALCSEHKIPLIKVPDGKQLGEWAGLCQIDREGNARKVVNCSCVVVKDWGEESQERSILLNYFQTEQ
ncbi:uncharacterized protein BDZ99DRAFT_505252 [Mytilinidion resinicola]|uniref:40S ribosomal protein S12 n=1 Tax=Mytilinidion resinicola TaxID=574789 RepID=A0A6A6Z9A9_9PEZI|nr:uncharacterized protein BDZ99DRAFT_505252 [Mytilinidion resinicola]KAF2817620.1 hypothetical protein BDZ99DRAFT_505252 [Mytilinidion resinicola]